MNRAFAFGKWPIQTSEIFYASTHSLALVNFKPIIDGHVLIIPRRVVPRFLDLSAQETTDLFATAQKVARVIETQFKAQGLTITIQDGPAAGQTVAHVHIHLIPRTPGDYFDNDDIYRDINQKEREMNEALKNGPDAAKEREQRSCSDMAAEAKMLRALFDDSQDIWHE